MEDQQEKIKVGSRQSQLALIQTRHVIKSLKDLYPEKTFDEVSMATLGDKILDQPLPKIGEKNLFTKELDIALANREVRFVVHSLKDLPTTLPDGMTIGAVLRREDPCDVVILHKDHESKTLETLPEGSVIGTSSLRRQSQLHQSFPHLKVESIRGNLNSRLRKLDEDGKYSAIILAAAGVKRMKWDSRISFRLEPEQMLYAVGQGALAVECHEDDHELLKVLEPLNDYSTILRVIAERSFLSKLGGGCTAPVAVHSELNDRTLTLTGAVWSLDGTETIKEKLEVSLDNLENGKEPPKKLRRGSDAFTGIWGGNINSCELKAAYQLGKDLAEIMNSIGALDIMTAAKKAIEQAILSKPKRVEIVSTNLVTQNCQSPQV